MSAPVLLTIEVEDSWFAKGSEGWLRNREVLRNDLERVLGPGAVQQAAPNLGDKGLPLIPIIVALGGARAFETLAKCFDAWLRNRPAERSLTVTRTVGGEEQTVHVVAQNAAIDALEPIARNLDTSFEEESGRWTAPSGPC